MHSLPHAPPETCYHCIKDRLDRPRKLGDRCFTYIAYTHHRNYTKVTPMSPSTDEGDMTLWSMDGIEP